MRQGGHQHGTNGESPGLTTASSRGASRKSVANQQGGCCWNDTPIIINDRFAIRR